MTEDISKDIQNQQQIINQTCHWIENVIIGHQYCPFAKRVVDNNQVRFQVFQSADPVRQVENVVKECLFLDQNPEIETTLIIYPAGLESFDYYLDFLALSENLLSAQGYEGEYQLASFHPKYLFQGAEEDDPANYTNRSPYPMLHLIREASIELALRHYENPEDIPGRNIGFARAQGLDIMRALLNDSLNQK